MWEKILSVLSRSGYSRIWEDYELPNIKTLTKLTSKVKTLDDMNHIQNIFSQLDEERQKCCLLTIDEVYVKSILQYHGDIVFGKAVNKPNKLGNTALSFMLICLSDGPKFLCRMLPVKQLNKLMS